MPLLVAQIVGALQTAPATENDRGNTIHRRTAAAERYVVDFADDFKAEGWEQFDTDQDAHYFGVWVNRQKMMTLSYAEGDWTLVVCPDREHYLAEVRDAIEFYGEGRIATGYGPEGVTIFRQDRQAFLADAPSGQ